MGEAGYAQSQGMILLNRIVETVGPLFTVTLLAENQRPLPLREVSRRWRVSHLVTTYESGQEFVVEERRSLSSEDVLVSEMEIKNNTPVEPEDTTPDDQLKPEPEDPPVDEPLDPPPEEPPVKDPPETPPKEKKKPRKKKDEEEPLDFSDWDNPDDWITICPDGTVIYH